MNDVKKPIWRDNTEPPKNYIWMKLSDSGSYLGTFEWNPLVERWVQISMGGGSAVEGYPAIGPESSTNDNLFLNKSGHFVAITGAGGTTNYNDLTNKPKVNFNDGYDTTDTTAGDPMTDKVLQGTLTYEQLHLYTRESIDKKLSQVTATLNSVKATTDNLPSTYYTKTQADAKYATKVTGKGLSTNDYTTADKSKLAMIEDGAQKNVQANWEQADTSKDDFIKNKPEVYTKTQTDEKFVKLEGDTMTGPLKLGIKDLTDANDEYTATPRGYVDKRALQPDWEQTDDTKYDFIKNKPLTDVIVKATITDTSVALDTDLSAADFKKYFDAHKLILKDAATGKFYLPSESATDASDVTTYT